MHFKRLFDLTLLLNFNLREFLLPRYAIQGILMNKLIDFMNRLTDMDWGWWPLVKCRPEKDEYIDSKVLAKITPLFGTLTGLIFIYISDAYNDLLHAVISIVLGWVFFFTLYKVSFAVAWNIRADRLKSNDESSS